MQTRTTRSTFSFNSPFKIRNVDEILPAGDYRVLTEEVEIEGLTRLAYRRVGTYLSIPSISASQHTVRLVAVDQQDIDAALLKDRDHTIEGSHPPRQ